MNWPKEKAYGKRWRLLVPVLLLTSVSPCLANTQYSGWIPVSGKGHIEYRWNRSESAVPTCWLEFRNLDDDDRTAYKGKIAYVYDGKDQTAPISILKFDYAGAKQSLTSHGSCERVTDVWLTNYWE